MRRSRGWCHGRAFQVGRCYESATLAHRATRVGTVQQSQEAAAANMLKAETHRKIMRIDMPLTRPGIDNAPRIAEAPSPPQLPMRNHLIALALLVSFAAPAAAQTRRLVKKWETEAALKTPESVLF